jgi:hypothetical protein
LNILTFTRFETNAKLRKKLANVECLGEVDHPPWITGGCGNSFGCGNGCDFGGFRKSFPKYSTFANFLRNLALVSKRVKVKIFNSLYI